MLHVYIPTVIQLLNLRITYSLDHCSNYEFSALLQREDDEFGV